MSTTEPTPLDEPRLEPWDFEALAEQRARSADYNEQRLRTRRKLLAWSKAAAAEAKAGHGLTLEVRTSLHNPTQWNGGTVRRLWAYLVRPKADKTKLKRVLGADLAKDLDNAYKNVYLCMAVEHEALEVSLRIHADAWYDGRNLTKKLAAEGLGPWRDHLNRLDGFQLKLGDWRGEWRCGNLGPERLEEYLKFYSSGEHLLSVERRWPVPSSAREAVLGDEVPAQLRAELLRLVELYRYTAWSPDNDYLFG